MNALLFLFLAALGALSALKVREHLLAQEDHLWHSALEEIRETETEAEAEAELELELDGSLDGTGG